MYEIQSREPTTKFCGEHAFIAEEYVNEYCHIWGQCIPDWSKHVITRPGDGVTGSVVQNVYFLHCDGLYYNAVRQSLGGAATMSVWHDGMKDLEEVKTRIASLKPDLYKVKRSRPQLERKAIARDSDSPST